MCDLHEVSISGQPWPTTKIVLICQFIIYILFQSICEASSAHLIEINSQLEQDHLESIIPAGILLHSFGDCI